MRNVYFKAMCIATTKSGELCKIKKVDEHGLCYRHRGEGRRVDGEKFVVVVDNAFAVGPFSAKLDAELEASKHESAVVLNLRNPKQVDVLVEGEGCCHVFSKGARKGEKCGNARAVGDFCSSHAPKADDGSGCDFILTRGANKGKMCGKKRCAAHNYFEEEVKADSERGNNDGCVYVFVRGKNRGEICGKKTTGGDFCKVHSVKNKVSKKKEDDEKEEEKHLHLEELQKLRNEVNALEGEREKEEDAKEENIELSDDGEDFEIPITQNSKDTFEHRSCNLKIFFDSEEVNGDLLKEKEQNEAIIDEDYSLKIRASKKNGNRVFVLKCLREEKAETFPVATVYKAAKEAWKILGLESDKLGEITYNNKSVYVWNF